ncbi:MAG: sugar transferase [Puniceicoccales bacterium]
MARREPISDPAAYWSSGPGQAKAEKWARAARRKIRIWRLTIALSEALKRLLDILGSLVALVIFSPIFAVTAALIKLEDRGPVFFRQIRIGRNGLPFGMYKFRSMVVNADKIKEQLSEDNQHSDGVTFKMKNDPRITQVGRTIRKLSVDEFPQFYNVLRGDMSLVGPRPPVPREVACYRSAHIRRLTVKPGITCLWQIGGRSDIDFEGQVRLDLQYIRSESIWQDVKILLLTVPAVLMGKGAY